VAVPRGPPGAVPPRGCPEPIPFLGRGGGAGAATRAGRQGGARGAGWPDEGRETVSPLRHRRRRRRGRTLASTAESADASRASDARRSPAAAAKPPDRTPRSASSEPIRACAREPRRVRPRVGASKQANDRAAARRRRRARAPARSAACARVAIGRCFRIEGGWGRCVGRRAWISFTTTPSSLSLSLSRDSCAWHAVAHTQVSAHAGGAPGGRAER
jgi:hypothetical protein